MSTLTIIPTYSLSSTLTVTLFPTINPTLIDTPTATLTQPVITEVDIEPTNGPTILSPINELSHGMYIIYSDRLCNFASFSITDKKIKCLISNIAGYGSMSPDGNWVFMCISDLPGGPTATPIIINLLVEPNIKKLDDTTLCPGLAAWYSDSNKIILFGDISLRLVQMPSGDIIITKKVFNFENDPLGQNYHYIDFGILSPSNQWVAYMTVIENKYTGPNIGGIYVTNTSCFNEPDCVNKTKLLSRAYWHDIFAWTANNELAIFSNSEGIIRFYDIEAEEVIRVIYNLPFNHPEVMKFSPDGKWLSIIYNSNLYLLNIEGGEIINIVDNVYYIDEWLLKK